ncbi:hypothetical protein DFH28DRAFT_1201774 [Melampsora americana]|nr:hypothetical protein DFH28DRAFT_1201774 [Melampsora americana]
MWKQLKKKEFKINYKSDRMLQAIKQAEEKKREQEQKLLEQAENRKRRARSRLPTMEEGQEVEELTAPIEADQAILMPIVENQKQKMTKSMLEIKREEIEKKLGQEAEDAIEEGKEMEGGNGQSGTESGSSSSSEEGKGKKRKGRKKERKEDKESSLETSGDEIEKKKGRKRYRDLVEKDQGEGPGIRGQGPLAPEFC